MRVFTCVCGQTLHLSDTNQQDAKCAACGRVYTANGRFLWRESPGNDLPGSSEFVEVPFIRPEEDRRDDDQDTALEKAFVQAKLPEEDRRIEDLAAVTPSAPVSKSARGDKRKA